MLKQGEYDNAGGSILDRLIIRLLDNYDPSSGTDNVQVLHEIVCRKPRGLLLVGLWTPMVIGRSVFLGVESGGGPEDRDGKMIRGVH